jgi:hypothetical protein
MDGIQEKRARELAEYLESAGVNCGVLVVQGTVVLRGPGARYSESLLLKFDPTDLQNAVALDLLEKAMVTGSYEWEWYVFKKKPAKA